MATKDGGESRKERMREVPIMWDDLMPTVQEALLEAAGVKNLGETNWGIEPVAVVGFDDPGDGE